MGRSKIVVKLTQVLRAMGESNLLRFSSFDVRIVIKLCALITAWKIVSIDYSAFQSLLPDLPLYQYAWGWVAQLAHLFHQIFFDTPNLVYFVQIGAAIFLIIGAILLSKTLLALGMTGVFAIELVAIQFRAFMYDMDIPVAVLLIAFCFSWKAIRTSSREVTPEATRIGTAMAAFFGMAYALAGWSKFGGDQLWFMHARLDMLYAVMDVWHSVTFPAWLDPIAKAQSQIFGAVPVLGYGAALLTMLSELFWWTALLSRWARYVIPVIMFGSHVLIFLGSGILFLSWAVLAIALIIPWRAFATPVSTSSTPKSKTGTEKLDLKVVFAVFIGMAVPLVPVVANTPLLMPFPFASYNIFGWSYGSVIGETKEYRLAYRDPETGEALLMPFYYGGFLDFRGITGPGLEIQSLALATTPQAEQRACDRLAQYIRALRANRSDRWLLGPFRHPYHQVAATTNIDLKLLYEPLLLRGDWLVTNDSRQVTWHVIGRIERTDSGEINCRLEGSGS